MHRGGGVDDLRQPAALHQLCAGTALVAAGFILALSLRVIAVPDWGRDRLQLRFGSMRWRADDGAVERSNAIHNRAVQLHDAILDKYFTPRSAGNDLLNMWDLFGPTFQCAEKERFGEWADGGKWVCSSYEVLGREPCFVFSLGSNGVSGFEQDVRSRYPHCSIDVYDPTISEETAAAVAAATNATVHRTWITDEGGFLRKAAEPGNQTYTTIAREMQILSVPWLNVLKMDIEGAEWQVFDDLFAAATLPFTMIVVELHIPHLPDQWGNALHNRLRYFFDGMTRHSYRVANNEINMRCGPLENCPNFIEYTLVKTDEHGRIITGPH